MDTREFGGKASEEGVHMLKKTGSRYPEEFKAEAVQQAAPELVGRNFTAAEPDRLWVADITYVRSREGFLYLGPSSSMPALAVGWSAGR